MSDITVPKLDTIYWEIYRGQDATLIGTLFEPDASSAVASGTTFAALIRDAENDTATLAATATITKNATTGEVSISLTDTQTAALVAGTTYYSQLWRDDSGVKQPVCRIEINVKNRTGPV